jgi:hypothetical protein
MSPLFGPFPTQNVTCKCAFKRSNHRPEQRHIVDRKGCKKSSPPFSSPPYLDLLHRSPQASSMFATEAGPRLRRDPRCLKLASSQTAQATNMQSAEDTAYISRSNDQQIKRRNTLYARAWTAWTARTGPVRVHAINYSGLDGVSKLDGRKTLRQSLDSSNMPCPSSSCQPQETP